MPLKTLDKKRVLIAEDDGAARALYAAILSDDIPGITVDQAANGSEAVLLFEKGQHGVIMMDVHMPVMDGLTAFHHIKTLCDRNKWEMPAIVFCTAYASLESLSGVLSQDNRFAMLRKPMTGAELVRAISERL